MAIKEFINFHLEKLIFNSCPVDDGDLIKSAFHDTVLDFQYHFPEMDSEQVEDSILRNEGGLPVFLYRLVKKMDKQEYEDSSKYHMHFLMKVLCGCELYWSSDIDVGFYFDHSVGTIIGSRCKIGKGFRVYQGCTVGHSINEYSIVKPKTFIPEEYKKAGPQIGDNVILFANSLILGNIKIGDNVTIAANSLVIADVEEGQVVAGNPAKVIKVKGA